MIEKGANNRVYMSVKNLKTTFQVAGGKKLTAVNDISFDLMSGEILGIVGESGSGKTVMVKSILKLVSAPGKIEAGQVIIDDENILSYTDRQMRTKVRGTKISMIFQEPMTALNPSFSVEWQISEVYRLHTSYTNKERRQNTLRLLEKVNIPDPEKRMKEYSHQFSGGMQQRVLIAIALACNPRVLIADEPTTALDVTVQADIMDLLEKMREKTQLSIILISHNLNLVTERSDRIIVIYAGMTMEIATSAELAENPLHPYTVGLLNSLPNMREDNQKITAIAGELPDLSDETKGCAFWPRCPKAMSQCREAVPELREITKGHFCRCHLY